MKICRVPDSIAAEAAGLKVHCASEEVGRQVRVRLASPIVRTVKDAKGEPMVLVDSGANVELKPFPRKWKGVPPKEAVRTTICLAMGKGLCLGVQRLFVRQGPGASHAVGKVREEVEVVGRPQPRLEAPPPTSSMPQPASAQEPAPHHPTRHGEVGWMLNLILGQVPINFFSEAVGEPPQAATGEAPIDEQAEPPVQPPAADHGADSAHGRQSANKALPRGNVGDQAQLHVLHACAHTCNCCSALANISC